VHGPAFSRAILRGIGQRCASSCPGNTREQGCVISSEQLRHRPPDLLSRKSAGIGVGHRHRAHAAC